MAVAKEAVLFPFSVLNWVFTYRHSKSEVYKWLQIWHTCKCISVVDIPTYVLLTILLFIDGSKMARIRINTRNHTKEKPYLINSYLFSQLVRQTSQIRVCVWVTYVLKEFCSFSLVTKNVKSRPKIALFLNERHFEIWFPKKNKAITIFWSKVSKLHKEDPILHMTTTFSLKQVKQ